MAYGVLPTGFAKKTVEVLKSEIDTSIAGAFPGAAITAESLLGQFIGIMSTKFGELWEVNEAFAANADLRYAIERYLKIIGTNNGILPQRASKSYVLLSITLAAGYTLPIHSIVASFSNGSIRFITRAAVTNGGGSTATFTVDADCEVYGPVSAVAGSLIVGVSPSFSPSAFVSCINLLDATTGSFAENDYSYRLRIARGTARGTRKVNAIIQAVLAVEGVISCSLRENVLDQTVGLMAPKSKSIVIYDGTSPQASDAEVGQAILNTKGFGIETNGAVVTSPVDSEGTVHRVRFSRATVLPVYLRIVVKVSGDATSAANSVRASVVAWGDANLEVGETVILSQMARAVIDVAQVVDHVATYIGTAPSPVQTTNLAVLQDEIADFDTSRIVVEVISG